MPTDQIPQESWNHPAVVILGVIVAVIVMLSLLTEKVQKTLGPIGKWIGDRQERARQRERKAVIAQGQLHDAIADDLREEIAELRTQIQDQRGWYQTELAELKAQHAREIAEIRAEHKSQMEEIRAEHAAELARIRARL